MIPEFEPAAYQFSPKIDGARSMEPRTVHKWDATDYAKSAAAQQGWATELIDTLNLCGDERILDLGCGDGKMTAALADRVPDGSVVGADKSSDMIAFATETFADRAPHLTFREVDAAALDFDTDFDLIFSNAALHWVSDHVAVTQGLARALRPKGRIVLSMGGRGNVIDVQAAMDETKNEGRWAEHFTDFANTYTFNGPDDYAEWLRDAGLAPARVELVPKDMVHTVDGFAAWIRTTWHPTTHRVPEDRRESFLADFLDRYLRRCPPDGDGKVHTAMIRLEVEATKPA